MLHSHSQSSNEVAIVAKQRGAAFQRSNTPMAFPVIIMSRGESTSAPQLW